MTKLHPYLQRDGVAGLVKYLDSPGRSRATRLLLTIDEKFIGAVQFARDFAAFESRIKNEPLPHVAREVYDYLGMDLRLDNLPDVFSQENQPAILMGINHEAIIEPIFLVSLLDRLDIRFLGMKVFQYLGPYIADYIFPVLPKKIATDYRGSSKATISNRLDPVYQLYKMENRTLEEISHLNQQAIENSTEHVANGGALMMYPCGGRPIDSAWYSGLGKILSGLDPKNLASTPIFPIRMTGLSRRFVYRKINRAAFKRQRRDSVYLNILAPIYVPSELSGSRAEILLDYVAGETESRLRSGTISASSDEMFCFPPKNNISYMPENPPVNLQQGS